MPEFIGRLRTPRLSAAPSSPVAGEVYYDTALAELKFFNSLTWVSIVQPYVLSGIPVSPVDGQEFYYVADTTNGIIWHFRYRSASASAYKWEFVGGSPLYAEVLTDQATAVTTYTALATAGPSITLPLAGDYIVEHGANIYGASGAISAGMSYDIGGTAAVDADAIFIASNAASTNYGSGARKNRKTGLGAVTLTAKYRATAGTANFRWRWLSVTPVRVG